jgi:hypothetical protein
MKPSIYRRIRRRSASSEAATFKKDNQPEQQFFGETMHEPFFKPAASLQNNTAVQRKCADCEKEDKVQRLPDKKEEKKKVQRAVDKKEDEKKLHRATDKKEEKEKVRKKETGASNANTSVTAANYIQSMNGKGQNMSAGVRNFYETKMGADFSKVKIHTGKDAAESAKDINAQAYNYGNHIVFNEGKFEPGTDAGKRLLAHELTHVLQQDGEHIQRLGEEEQPAVEAPSAAAEEPSAAVEEPVSEMEEQMAPINIIGKGTSMANKTDFANCAGVNVQGRTTANYDHGTYAANSTSVTRAPACPGCTGTDCITAVGTVVSDFHANPSVVLPGVPSGLNTCEQNAVQTFITTTLSQHEQQHVSAFNTYNGTVTTPFSYTGCRAGFDAYILSIHNGVEAGRVASANALSAALDPFNPAIPCACPDPAPPDAGTK